jgi:hypothetical protein
MDWSFYFSRTCDINTRYFGGISGSHGGENEDGSLLRAIIATLFYDTHHHWLDSPT